MKEVENRCFRDEVAATMGKHGMYALALPPHSALGVSLLLALSISFICRRQPPPSFEDFHNSQVSVSRDKLQIVKSYINNCDLSFIFYLQNGDNIHTYPAGLC